jgi:hypothetical protein
LTARDTPASANLARMAKAHILDKHLGPDERFLLRGTRDGLPTWPSQDRGRSASGILVDPGGDLVTGRLPESLAGILAALPGQKATS